MSYDGPEQQAICQRSGFKYPISQLVREWTGLLVHRRFVDKRNPQDFVRAAKENPPPRIASPEPANTFIVGNGPTQTDL